MTASNNPLVLRENSFRPITNAQVDQNFKNCMRYALDWATGDTYAKNQLVRHQGGIWITLQDGATDEPAWSSTQWEGLTPIPGRGGMDLSAPAAGTDIGAGAWLPLEYFDTEILTPYGFTTDPLTGRFQFGHVGLWQLQLSISFAHNNLNAGRTLSVRMYNITDAVAGNVVPFGISRNSDETFVSFPVLLPVSDTAIGDIFRFEIGGGDAVSTITYNVLSFSAVQLSIF